MAKHIQILCKKEDRGEQRREEVFGQLKQQGEKVSGRGQACASARRRSLQKGVNTSTHQEFSWPVCGIEIDFTVTYKESSSA